MARPTPDPAPQDGGRRGLLRALRSRNYRLFFFGQTISLIGTFLSQIATIWLVYDLTKSPLMLGTVAFAGQIPLLFLAPFGGVWADRWNRRRVLVVTQVLSMLQSLAMAALALTRIRVWEVVALAFAQGVIACFDMPARQAFTVEMVEDRRDLPNAIALNSTMMHTARTLGPAAAGFLVYAVGPGLCFLIDGLSYIAVIASLLMMDVRPPRPRPRPPGTRSVLAELHEGLAYAWSSVPIRVILLFLALLSMTGAAAYNTLMPIFADAFAPPGAGGGGREGSRVLGLLQGATGAGSLACAVYLASRRSVVGLGRVIAAAGFLYGGSVIAFAAARRLGVALAIAPVVGFAALAVFASANTLLQTLAADDKRGRVMSLFTVAFMGVAPFGNLLAGVAAARLGGRLGSSLGGAAATVALAGLIDLVAAAFFAATLPMIRSIVRPIYVQMGILPGVPGGGGGGLEEPEPA